MRDSELIARFNRRVDMVQRLERVRVLHAAQKAGISGPSLFVEVRKGFEPELSEATKQFIEKEGLHDLPLCQLP